MTYGTFGLCVWVFLMSSFGIIVLVHSRKIKQRKIKEDQVRFLESAMRKAKKEKLDDANETLSLASFDFSYGYVVLPKFFWETHDLELIARTLRTCIKIFQNKNARKDVLLAQKEVYERWGRDLVRLAETDLRKAMAILVILCTIDNDAGPMMVQYLASSGKRRCWYAAPFEAWAKNKVPAV